MSKLSDLFADLKYYGQQFHRCGEALVELSQIDPRSPGIAKVATHLAGTYTMLARYIASTSKDIRSFLLGRGRYLKNPYELDLSKVEHLYRMVRSMAEAAIHKIERCQGRRKQYTAAMAAYRIVEQDVRAAAQALLLVAQHLGKDTPEWRRRLKIDEWL